MAPKNAGAVELARLRWKDRTVKEKRDHALMMVRRRIEKYGQKTRKKNADT